MRNVTPLKQYLLILFAAFVLLLPVQVVFAHGTVTYPPSRIWNCYQENPESPDSPACIAAVASHGTQALYDWNEINQGMADGDHRFYIMDGNLASGGRWDKYGGMDQVRTDWVATPVSPGPLTVKWSNSAPHATSYYEVYITTEDWSPDQPLTWDKLILLERTDPSPADSTVNIPVTLPERTGKHVLYSIWQRSDSPEAFYSTSDVDFGAGTTAIGDEVDASSAFGLQSCFPNPFNKRSTLTYNLRERGRVSLKVYDVCGKEVATLATGLQSAGQHDLIFSGENLSNGIYLCVLRSGNLLTSKRLVLQR